MGKQKFKIGDRVIINFGIRRGLHGEIVDVFNYDSMTDGPTYQVQYRLIVMGEDGEVTTTHRRLYLQYELKPSKEDFK